MKIFFFFLNKGKSSQRGYHPRKYIIRRENKDTKRWRGDIEPKPSAKLAEPLIKKSSLIPYKFNIDLRRNIVEPKIRSS
jgi:hypothetical protein